MRPSSVAALLAGLLLLPTVRAQALSARDAEAALAHVRTQAAARGLAASDAADLAVSSGHASPETGLAYVYVQQRAHGLDVAEAIVSVAVRDGRVVHAAGQLVGGVDAVAPAPTLSAEAAVGRARRCWACRRRRRPRPASPTRARSGPSSAAWPRCR